MMGFFVDVQFVVIRKIEGKLIQIDTIDRATSGGRTV